MDCWDVFIYVWSSMYEASFYIKFFLFGFCRWMWLNLECRKVLWMWFASVQYFLLCDGVLVFWFSVQILGCIQLTLKIQVLLQFSSICWLEKMNPQSSWHEVDDGKDREKFVKLMLQVCDASCTIFNESDTNRSDVGTHTLTTHTTQIRGSRWKTYLLSKRLIMQKQRVFIHLTIVMDETWSYI